MELFRSDLDERSTPAAVSVAGNKRPRRNVVRATVLVMTLTMTGLAVPNISEARGEFQRALEAARSGDLQRSIELWTATIARNPRSYAAYVNRGSALLRSGHIFRGIKDWEKAKRYSPVFAYAFCAADFIEQAGGKKRILNYAKSLELDPDYVASVTMTGATLLDLGRTEDALGLFRSAMELTRNPLLKNHYDHWIKSLESGSEK